MANDNDNDNNNNNNNDDDDNNDDMDGTHYATTTTTTTTKTPTPTPPMYLSVPYEPQGGEKIWSIGPQEMLPLPPQQRRQRLLVQRVAPEVVAVEDAQTEGRGLEPTGGRRVTAATASCSSSSSCWPCSSSSSPLGVCVMWGFLRGLRPHPPLEGDHGQVWQHHHAHRLHLAVTREHQPTLHRHRYTQSHRQQQQQQQQQTKPQQQPATHTSVIQIKNKE